MKTSLLFKSVITTCIFTTLSPALANSFVSFQVQLPKGVKSLSATYQDAQTQRHQELTIVDQRKYGIDLIPESPGGRIKELLLTDQVSKKQYHVYGERKGSGRDQYFSACLNYERSEICLTSAELQGVDDNQKVFEVGGFSPFASQFDLRMKGLEYLV